MSVYLRKYCVSLIIHQENSLSAKPKQVLRWVDLPWDVRKKWDWYFTYRAALAQVQNPKSKVVRHDWTVDPTPEDVILLKKKEISAAKGQVTKIENLLNKARKHWNKLFPIEEDILYQRSIAKYNVKMQNLIELEIELKKLEEDGLE